MFLLQKENQVILVLDNGIKVENMNVDGIENKENGWDLIVEAEYSLERIRRFIKSSCLVKKESFIKIIDDIENVEDENVQKLCAAILAFLDGKNTLDEITSLCVAACMIYSLEGASVESIEIRTNLFYTAFFEMDILSPQHLHVAVDRIWENLKNENEISYVMLIISLCRELCTVNATGKAIAICLAWAILCEISETDLHMFCFHKFSDINIMLKEIDENVLQLEEKTEVVYILIQVVGLLINMIVFGKNDVFLKAGYGPYFAYKRKDLEKLKDWAEQLANILCAANANPRNYWDLRMSMTEYLKMNIVSLLYDKIRDV